MSDETDGGPWLPDGHVERLVVGARVRIVRSAECPNLWCKKIDADTGIIISALPPIDGNGWDHHDYRVWDGVRILSGWFAASELMPAQEQP